MKLKINALELEVPDGSEISIKADGSVVIGEKRYPNIDWTYVPNYQPNVITYSPPPLTVPEYYKYITTTSPYLAFPGQSVSLGNKT